MKNCNLFTYLIFFVFNDLFFFQFHCDPDSKVEYVGQVDEPLSCEYVINIYTSRICSLSAFKPPPEPKPKEIRCHPMLNEEEYVKFEAYERGSQQ